MYANDAGNISKRKPYYGIIIYVNNVPIIWSSKRHNTVEASSFVSEFVALRIAIDMIEALRYKLRCFGVPVEGPAEVFFWQQISCQEFECNYISITQETQGYMLL